MRIYPAPQWISALQPGWARVVVAFDNPDELDFRAGNIVWHVTSDGRIDPEHFQSFPGLPPTLAAMFAYFGVPASSTSPAGQPARTEPSLRGLVIAWSLAGGMLIWRRFHGSRHRESPA